MSKRFEFSDFVLDGEAHELRRGGRTVNIEPRAFELLLLLAERPGHAFSKDEIAAALWPGRVISDTVIAQCVRKARDATGDSAATQSVIKTVHGVGYRFSAEPAINETQENIQAVRPIPVLLMIAALLALASTYWLPRSEPESRRQLIVAVLPMEQDGEVDVNLAEGLESLLVRGISEQSPVRVISSAQTRQILEMLDLESSDSDEPLLSALRGSIGADYLLRPRVEDSEVGYQARAVLVDIKGAEKEITPPPGDIAAMVRGFSRSLAAELGVDWHELEGAALLSEDNFVNEAYARGLRAALSGENRSAVSLFESVLHLEPGLAWARYELGFAQWQLGEIEIAQEHFQGALKEAESARNMRLAGHALTMLGVLAWQGGDLTEAENRYTLALEYYRLAEDGHAAASALGNLGILAENRGDLDQAIDFYLQARERFRAVHDQVGESAVYTNLAILSRLRGRLHEAASQQAEAVAIQRRLGIGSKLVRSLTHLASIDFELGRLRPATELLEEAETLARQHENRHGLADIELERARRALRRLQPETAAGHAENALATFTELEVAASIAMAMALLAESKLAALDPDAALEWLDRADQTDDGISKPKDRADRSLIRVRAMRMLGLENEARAQLQSMTAHDSPAVAARARAELAALHWDEQRFDEAFDEWYQALQAVEHVDEPMQRADIQMQLASALIELEALDEANRLLTLIDGWNSEDPRAIVLRARLHIARDELPEARAVISRLPDSDSKPLRSREIEALLLALNDGLSGAD